jgi:hypothetical protein
MSGTTYRAINIRKAAKNTFARYGNESYAIDKANNFLRRCGAKLEDGPKKGLEKTVKVVKRLGKISWKDHEDATVDLGFEDGYKFLAHSMNVVMSNMVTGV